MLDKKLAMDKFGTMISGLMSKRGKTKKEEMDVAVIPDEVEEVMEDPMEEGVEDMQEGMDKMDEMGEPKQEFTIDELPPELRAMVEKALSPKRSVLKEASLGMMGMKMPGKPEVKVMTKKIMK